MNGTIKTRRDARVWVYRSCVAHSLRRRAQSVNASDISPEATHGAVKRVKAEMIALADWLERRAARLEKAKHQHTEETANERSNG
jgi:hypothetical protein